MFLICINYFLEYVFERTPSLWWSLDGSKIAFTAFKDSSFIENPIISNKPILEFILISLYKNKHIWIAIKQV